MKGLTALIIAAIILCLIGIMMLHKFYLSEQALDAWAVVNTDICSLAQGPKKLEVVPCSTVTTITPPPAPRRIKTASGVFDHKAWTFAVTANAAFVSYIGGNPMPSMPASSYAGKDFTFTPPQYIYVAGDVAPLAAVWVSKDKTWAVVVIRGTMTLNDLVEDLNFNYLNSPLPDVVVVPGSIHPGIATMYAEISGALAAAIPLSVTQLTITGHSLGAGIGFVFASETLSKRGTAVAVDVYGVAPPRVGDKTFAASISQKAAHCGSLINVADTVPALPWSYMINLDAPYTPLQYSHVGSLSVFNNLLADTISNHMLPAYYQGLGAAKSL